MEGEHVTLAKELGLYRRLPSADWRELRQNGERADRTARTLYEHVKARRGELLAELQSLNRLEVQAHEAGPNHSATWGALDLCYHKRPAVLAELAVLENASAGDLVRFFYASAEERERAIEAVMIGGGFYNSHGRF